MTTVALGVYVVVVGGWCGWTLWQLWREWRVSFDGEFDAWVAACKAGLL